MMRRPVSCAAPRRLAGQGLTLVEMMVSVVIVGVLAAAAGPSFLDMMERRRVIATANEVSSMMAYAKTETAARNAPVDVDISRSYAYGSSPTPISCVAVSLKGSWDTCFCWLKAGESCVATFKGKQLVGGTMLRSFVLPVADGVTIDTQGTNWPMGGVAGKLSFSPNQATLGIATDVQIHVKGKRGSALDLALNPAGRITICSPKGDMAGFVKC
jgi:prepilin-type N-terminal cleavage/methylation domain-containing protein